MKNILSEVLDVFGVAMTYWIHGGDSRSPRRVNRVTPRRAAGKATERTANNEGQPNATAAAQNRRSSQVETKAEGAHTLHIFGVSIMVFDILCYALAIAATLAFVGGSNRKAPATRPVLDTLATLHAIGEALPEDCFAIDVPDYDELFAEADRIAPPAAPAGTFDCGAATAEEAALVEAAEVAIAIHWESRPTCNVVPFKRKAADELDGLSIRALRQVVRDRQLKIVGYGSLPKPRLIEAIRKAS